MNNPKTSLSVVTNGPVAKAGSILYLFMINGIIEPITAAKRITTNNATLTVIPSRKSENAVAIPKIHKEQINPFNKPIMVSFKSLEVTVLN